MKYTHTYSAVLGAFFALAFPFIASAHALPVSDSPESSAVLSQAPSIVTIRFSEHIDQSASSIVVTDASGTTVSLGDAKTDPSDTHSFSVGMKGDGDGTYVVQWSAVSSDDGHFTKGAYPFAVGKGEVVQSSAASTDVEIVELTTAPEALTSAIELLGHGLLWAALLLFAFGMRALLQGGMFEDEARNIRRVYEWCIYVGTALAFFGGAGQIAVKTSQLAGLRSIDTIPALWIYLGTDAGAATLYRMLAVVVFLGIFLFARKAIFAAKKFTSYEIALVLTLCVFAYMRAKISHATSNPFHPQFSILMNFFHVIEKDVWTGIVGILFVLVLMPRMRRFLVTLIPRAFQMLAVDFGAVSVTACYIVWLHLKSFDNMFSTQWGSAFLELLVVAVLLVGMRIYHVLARLYRPKLFSRVLPVSLAAELAFGILVVYCSSVVIITSPPLQEPPTPIYSAHDQGINITLQQDTGEDGMLELTDSGGSGTQTPVLTVQDKSTTEDPLAIQLSQRFTGGYVFPQLLLAGKGPFEIGITVPQTGGYDAHAKFEVPKGAFTLVPGWESERPFDLFTVIMILIALCAFAVAVPLYKLSGCEAPLEPLPSRRFLQVASLGAFLVFSFFGADLIASLHGSALENPYAAECNGDANEWHTMLPSMAGVPNSQTPEEGCMWGMGNYMYMFPDKREYDYYAHLAPANVTLTTLPSTLVSGVPAVLTLSMKETDGSPAKLFIDMDKIVHVVIVSKDETVYAHIHPDDIHPLTQQELDSSTFTLNYTFPKSGDYIVMVDYAHGVTLESKQFIVHVAGGNPQSTEITQYPQEGDFDGYHIAVDYFQPIAGEVETFKYTITKNGQPVTLVPYLSAAMHISVVENDLSWHAHVHGEVHPPGVPLPPIIVRNGQVLHSMAAMMTPDQFTLPVDAHLIFPSAGLYTVWGQFKTQSGDLVAAAFTVRVDQ